MKTIPFFLSLLLLVSCVNGKEKKFTASTPADPLVKNFLEIPVRDSIDFIRWSLSLEEDRYTLLCNYGIGKPNTNGFVNDGKKIELNGALKKEKNKYFLYNGKSVLKLAELNDNLLHILNEDNSFLIGNGGWSYALNSLTPAASEKSTIFSRQSDIKDSLVFRGRTPCGVPGIMAPGKECYKLKWLVTFYAGKNTLSTYRLRGTPWYEEGDRKGTWKMITGKDGRIIYQLNNENDKPFIYLLKLDDGVLIFTDAAGNLLVGDHDFSYTLNRLK